MLATMYIKYIQIFRRLEQCYDQIVHPQKRRVLRHVLDGTMGRILELKNEMVNLEFSEFHYFDDVLSDLKLTPVNIYKKAWCYESNVSVCSPGALLTNLILIAKSVLILVLARC